jgi:hypothetical protein
MEVLIILILSAVILAAVCAVGVVVEVFWKIIDPSHKIFSGEFWKFKWLKSLLESSGQTSHFNETEFDRKWEADRRSEKAYDDYKSYRGMGMSSEDIDDRMRYDGYSKDERDSASYKYNKSW